jgi:rSAM/selenodomain-associated transferase 1
MNALYATQLGMFAKFWQPGQVKTRLAAVTGNDAASAVYKAFIATLLARLESVRSRRVLAYWPPERRDDFAGLVDRRPWELHAQSEGDLGARMRFYFEQAFAAGAERAVLIGSDSPTLPREYVEQALELLEQYSVVLGPSDDGGYYLLGLSEPPKLPPIFDEMPWSTTGVWGATVARLKDAGVDFATLPEWYDVDDLDDLRRLSDELHNTAATDDELTHLRRVVYAALTKT